MVQMMQTVLGGGRRGLRIAWPSFGTPALLAEPPRAPDMLRREEIESLFANDLRARLQRPQVCTDR